MINHVKRKPVAETVQAAVRIVAIKAVRLSARMDAVATVVESAQVLAQTHVEICCVRVVALARVLLVVQSIAVVLVRMVVEVLVKALAMDKIPILVVIIYWVGKYTHKSLWNVVFFLKKQVGKYYLCSD